MGDPTRCDRISLVPWDHETNRRCPLLSGDEVGLWSGMPCFCLHLWLKSCVAVESSLGNSFLLSSPKLLATVLDCLGAGVLMSPHLLWYDARVCTLWFLCQGFAPSPVLLPENISTFVPWLKARPESLSVSQPNAPESCVGGFAGSAVA